MWRKFAAITASKVRILMRLSIFERKINPLSYHSMEKAQLAALLNEKHAHLVEWLKAQPAENWSIGPESKWTAGQHILHLIQSTKPLLLALSLPACLLRFRFGKANRPSLNYEAMVARYHERLSQSNGIVSPFSRNMPDTLPEEKEKLMA